jgi:hypothetical protein
MVIILFSHFSLKTGMSGGIESKTNSNKYLDVQLSKKIFVFAFYFNSHINIHQLGSKCFIQFSIQSFNQYLIIIFVNYFPIYLIKYSHQT